MNAFYVSIIFLGVILVIAALFFIIMDKANGKDFFKELDRKKDEMFNLIQDSEEMVHELNKMSDYVVTVISEKNQEFFEKNSNLNKQEEVIEIENVTEEQEKLSTNIPDNQVLLDAKESANESKLSEDNDLNAVKNEDLSKNNKAAVLYNKKDSVLQYKNSVQQNKELISEGDSIGLGRSGVVYEPQNAKTIGKENELSNKTENIDLPTPNIIDSPENNTEDNTDIDNSQLTQNNSNIVDNPTTTSKNDNKDINSHEPIDHKKSKLTLSGNRAEVLKMIESGLTDEEISEKLRVGKGEISLIRGLSNK